MNKILVCILVGFMIIALCACDTGYNSPTEPSVAGTNSNTHTMPPTASTDQPEWCNIDCDINLVDNDVIYISSEDFETFALIGSNDSDCAIRFKLSTTGADMMTSYSKSGTKNLTLSVNGEDFAVVDVSSITADGVFEVKGQYTFEELCNWANIIRGL